jgi:glycine oxidase
MMDVAVVGGGVIGCAVARELALAGLQVAVLERAEPGENASWAAAGMLSPLAEADRPDPFLDLLLASRRMYPDFAEALREEAGVDVAYRDEGTLLAALTDDDEQELRARFGWQRDAGLPVEWLSAATAGALEPALSPRVRAALRFADDHQVDNRLLAPALWTAAERAGAVMKRGAEVVRVVRSAGQVEGVELADGELVRAESVVLAAGAWAAQLAGLPTALPVRPVHGQLLALSTAPGLLRHVLDSPRVYLVPRANGRVIVGATVEEIGFDRRVTAGGTHALLHAALELVPELTGASLVESWSGHRPGTPDGWPILGPDPDLPKLLYATGHYRNGILLTPITARAIAALVTGDQLPVDLAPFAVGRL